MPVDLLALRKLGEFDVFLGMDWLTKYYATIDCKNRTVTFREPGQTEMVFSGCRSSLFAMTISSSRARQLISCGCVAYLTSVVLRGDDDTLRLRISQCSSSNSSFSSSSSSSSISSSSFSSSSFSSSSKHQQQAAAAASAAAAQPAAAAASSSSSSRASSSCCQQQQQKPGAAAADVPIPDPPVVVPPPPVVIPPVVSGPSSSDSAATKAEHERSLSVLTAFMRFNPPMFDGKEADPWVLETWFTSMEALFEDIYPRKG
uniref:Reverse transcriptase domain-containing protein n=1 Tax=Ananas comosus var. bracteatus TaxID=296719 RepID=A0A6V7QCU5_ANACO|nr:unnamed protein product [Ananas comosus var. bracteatus]